MKNIIIALTFILFTYSACTDVIEVDSGFETPTLVIDAWINNMNVPQTVRMTLSQDYFNSDLAKAIENAEVSVLVNNQEDLVFVNEGNGNYVWSPQGSEVIGQVGDSFKLQVKVDGKEYEANTKMKRVPEIDSIAQVYEEEQIGLPEGIYAELYATDLPGSGDSYWAKTYKNGNFLNKPQEMLLIFDATFDSGNNLDGVPFIFPLRRGINPIPDEVEVDEELPPPYVIGDSIYVELMSISNEAFRFMAIALEQMTNGDNGIFALPVANTRSNIKDVSSEEKVLGFFNVGAVSTESKVIR